MKLFIDNVWGFVVAARGARRSMKSTGRMDSTFTNDCLGPKDKALLLRLIKASDEYAKGMRKVQVWFSVEATRYWWQEMSTYRIGVEWDSESTMHRLVKDLDALHINFKCREITDLDIDTVQSAMFAPWTHRKSIRSFLEVYQLVSLGDQTINIDVLKSALPEGFLQIRDGMVSYQTLRRMYHQRKNHRLQEWHTMFDLLLERLPNTELITCDGQLQDDDDA